MLRRLTIVAVYCALAASLLVPIAASASVPTGVPSPWESDEGAQPTSVTASVTCVIVEVRDDRMLLVRDELDRQHEIQIPEKAKIRPQSKKDFDGLKKLQFEHLRPGFELKLTFLRSTGEVVRVKVLDTEAAA